MNRTLTYSGILTKVKSMSSIHLSQKELEALIQLENTADYVNFLRQKPSYKAAFFNINESNVHRGQIEKIIRSSLYYDFIRLYTFATPEQRHSLDLILLRYEIDILKQSLEFIFNQKTNDTLSSFHAFFEQHSKLKLNALLEAESLEQFIELLKGTQYFPVLSRLQDASSPPLLKDYENQLDIYYFQEVWRFIKKQYKGREQKAFFAVFGTQADLLNILWIYRSLKSYCITPEKRIASIIPVHYRLKKEQITALVNCSNISEFEAALSGTFYRSFFTQIQESTPEAVCFHMMNHRYKRTSSRISHSILPVFYELFLKEHEIDQVTTALECIRYQLDPSEALTYINNK